MKLINAEIKDIYLENSTFNVLLSFPFKHRELLHALIYCRVEGNIVKAYDIGIMGGTCPCCLKPTCSSFFAKRQELLEEAQKFVEFPKELIEKSTITI
jgi:hypothetical protein